MNNLNNVYVLYGILDGFNRFNKIQKKYNMKPMTLSRILNRFVKEGIVEKITENRNTKYNITGNGKKYLSELASEVMDEMVFKYVNICKISKRVAQ